MQMPLSLVAVVSLGCATHQAWAQMAVTLQGPPVQMQPYVPEPGAPIVTVNPGTPTPFPDEPASSSNRTGSSSAGGNDALTTLLGTSWGAQAAADAQTLGVNASALAATCVMETTTCSSNGATASGPQGVFQMYPGAFSDGLKTALAADPALASQVNSSLGPNDPTTAAIASAGYLLQGVQVLQAAGDANPTVTDARAYYQFGPSSGVALATASPDQLVSSVVSLTPAQFAANGINPATTTVGQWQQTIASKVGSAATQSVLQ